MYEANGFNDGYETLAHIAGTYITTTWKLSKNYRSTNNLYLEDSITPWIQQLEEICPSYKHMLQNHIIAHEYRKDLLLVDRLSMINSIHVW